METTRASAARLRTDQTEPPIRTQSGGGTAASAGRILIVDDDQEMRLLMRNYLEREGFTTDEAAHGSQMREAMRTGPVPDIVILDLGLPGEDGLSLVRFLRAGTQVGILIVSGKNDTLDRVIGLEVGADDYLPKPFDLRELLARVRSLMRRNRSAAGQDEGLAEPNPLRTFDGWRLDLMQRRLTAPDGREVRLSTGEFNLLMAFLDAPNRVLSRDELMERLHGRAAGPFDRGVDVQVGRLRRKLGDDPEQPVLIKSIRGAGYFFAACVRDQ